MGGVVFFVHSRRQKPLNSYKKVRSAKRSTCKAAKRTRLQAVRSEQSRSVPLIGIMINLFSPLLNEEGIVSENHPQAFSFALISRFILEETIQF